MIYILKIDIIDLIKIKKSDIHVLSRYVLLINNKK